MTRRVSSDDWSTYGVVGAIVIGAIGLYQMFHEDKPPKRNDLKGRIFVVTGSNTGVGYATASQLARNGASVVLACRNRTLGDEAVQKIVKATGNADVTYQHLDLTSLDSIHKFSSNVKKCHVLVNNAGAMFMKAEYVHDIEKTFFTNYIGQFLLTKLMLPVLVKTSIDDNTEVRIVNVGSRSEQFSSLGSEYSRHNDNTDMSQRFELCTKGPQPYEMWSAYGTSKLCDLLFTYEFDRRLKKGGDVWNIFTVEKYDNSIAGDTSSSRNKPRITINSVTPGMTNTSISRWASSWKLWLSYPIRAIAFKSCDQGAESITYVASSPDLTGISGKYYADKRPIESSTQSHDEGMACDLWDETERIIKEIEMKEGNKQ